MNKYWVKCLLPNQDDMILVTHANDPEEAAIKIMYSYNIEDVIEVKNEPYITQEDFMKDTLHRICRNNLYTYKHKSRIVKEN